MSNWGKPLKARRWHIFDEAGGRSRCGNWYLGKPAEQVMNDDEWEDGNDCKTCCRKEGLLNE